MQPSSWNDFVDHFISALSRVVPLQSFLPIILNLQVLHLPFTLIILKYSTPFHSALCHTNVPIRSHQCIQSPSR